MEDAYAEFTVLDASGKRIIGEQRMSDIECRLDEIGDWMARLDPISATLERMEKGGRYQAIAYDMSDGKIIFINHDGTRSAYEPEQIALLFGVGPRRAAPAFRS